MTLPAGLVPTTNLDQSTDSPDSARLDLLNLVTQFNVLCTNFGTADGLATLDSNGLVTSTQLPGPGILTALLAVDGTGSGLDADKLQGVVGTGYVLTDASRPITVPSSSNPFPIIATATASGATTPALELRGSFPTGGDAGLSTGLWLRLSNSAGTTRGASTIMALWTTATAGAEESDVVFSTSHSGSIVEALRIRGQRILEIPEITSSGSPPSGKWWLWATSSALMMQQHGGSATAIITSGSAVDHNTLLNLTVGDVHTQYFRTDGTRVLTADLQLGAHSILSTDQSSNPAAPSSGLVKLFTKGGQLYYRSPSAVVGPITTSSFSGSHHDLTNLTTGDDHTQYLLRQPTADVVINNSAADYDFLIKGSSDATLFNLDAGANQIAIGGAVLGNAKLEVSPGSFSSALYLSGGLSIATASTHLPVSITHTGTSLGLSMTRQASGVVTLPDLGILNITDGDATHGGLLFSLSQHSANGAMRVWLHTSDSAFAVEATEVVVNDAGRNDVSFRVEGDTIARLLAVDAASDVVCVNVTSTVGRLNVYGGSTKPGIYTYTDSNFAAIQAETRAGETAILINALTGSALGLDAYSVESVTARFTKNLAGGTPVGAAAVGVFVADNTDTAAGLYVQNFGTGDAILALVPAGGFRLTSDGALHLPVLSGDPAAPATGQLAVYAKSGGLYIKVHGGTVTGPL